MLFKGIVKAPHRLKASRKSYIGYVQLTAVQQLLGKQQLCQRGIGFWCHTKLLPKQVAQVPVCHTQAFCQFSQRLLLQGALFN